VPHEERIDVRFLCRRNRKQPELLPAVRRVTVSLEERFRDFEQRLDGFSARLAGAADQAWRMAQEASDQVDEATARVEEHDGHDT
jgi:hypothetical protein